MADFSKTKLLVEQTEDSIKQCLLTSSKLHQMAPKKVYLVFEGRTLGIYYSLIECKNQVDGYPSNIYKGYENINEAVKEWDQNKPKLETEMKVVTERDPINKTGEGRAESSSRNVTVFNNCTFHFGSTDRVDH